MPAQFLWCRSRSWPPPDPARYWARWDEFGPDRPSLTIPAAQNEGRA